MDKTIKLNKYDINKADRIIVALKSGAKYLYDGIFQYKFHENGAWGYCDNYDSNYDYLTHMYSLCTIHSIELLHKDSNNNKTIYKI